MSDFANINPFADPHAISTPFADPAVQQVRQQSAIAAAAASTDSFDPFGNGSGVNSNIVPKLTTVGVDKSQPAVLPQEQPPPYSAAFMPRKQAQDTLLEQRQRELDEREQQINRKAEEIRLRDERINSTQTAGGIEIDINDPMLEVTLYPSEADRSNNWPPIPSFCPMGPCFFQDFDVDIPNEFRRLVKMGYYMWMMHTVVLFVNVFGTLSYFIGSSAKSDSGTVFGVSLLILVIFTPSSFVCWYRPLYKAFRSDSSFNFFVFFIIFFSQFVILVIQCLGLNWLGSCGWINSLAMMGTNTGVAIFMLLIAAAFTALAVIDMMLLIRVHRIYRGSGASFEKAKAEFSQGVTQSSSVRNAASEFGSAMVHGAVSNAAGTGANRY